MFWQRSKKRKGKNQLTNMHLTLCRSERVISSLVHWTLHVYMNTSGNQKCKFLPVCDQMVTHKKSTLIVACSVNIWTVVPKFFPLPTGHLNNYLLTTSSIFSFWICTKDLFYQKSLFFSEDFSHGSPKSNERLARETFLKSTQIFSLTIHWLYFGS